MARKSASEPQPLMILSDRNEGVEPKAPTPLIGAKLKADQTTIAVEATKDGKLRCRASSWQEPLVVLLGRQLVIRNVAGQVNVFDVPAE